MRPWQETEGTVKLINLRKEIVYKVKRGVGKPIATAPYPGTRNRGPVALLGGEGGQEVTLEAERLCGEGCLTFSGVTASL